MITEICRLHSKLNFDQEIILKMTRYEAETKIVKADILKKVGPTTLKVIKPNGEIRLINTNYVVIAYYGRRSLL